MAGAPSGGPKPSALVQGDQRRNVITVRVTTDAGTEGFKKELDSEWLKGIKQHNPSALI
jgi:hypothetical protein